MTSPTIYSGSERILRAGVFCTLLDLTLTVSELVEEPKKIITVPKKQKKLPKVIPATT